MLILHLLISILIVHTVIRHSILSKIQLETKYAVGEKGINFFMEFYDIYNMFSSGVKLIKVYVPLLKFLAMSIEKFCFPLPFKFWSKLVTFKFLVFTLIHFLSILVWICILTYCFLKNGGEGFT